ncbi:hypothetical protein Psal069_03308 (plasmid) [Piscirickettsia salmonis]|nr:hypothetical protein Psal005_03335 [Piscirickettsia salmonis]QGO18050.1 hypothetical protein Psal011_03309 [Piscirickettsia salmonis]QGO53873.1 hypothetical protein Psal069_03308 [Piscirickettsia salmonis]
MEMKRVYRHSQYVVVSRKVEPLLFEKAQGRFSILLTTEHPIQSMAIFINRSIKVIPAPFNFNQRFIQPPRGTRLTKVGLSTPHK